jgi:hypothetical protein
MKIMSLTVETVYWVSQVLSFVLLAGTVVLGGIALFTGKVLNDRQSVALEEQRQKTEGLQKANIEAQSALEKERAARVEMEKSLAIRELPFISIMGTSNAGGLKPFAGCQFILRSLPEAEPARAASSLLTVLELAGWVKAGRELSPEYMSPEYDGVTICTGLGAKSTESERAAAKALVEFLNANGWEAHKGKPHDDTPNTILITVGFEPAPYFLSKQHEEWRKEIKRLVEEAGGEEELLKQLQKLP